jgi:hypothetical protein
MILVRTNHHYLRVGRHIWANVDRLFNSSIYVFQRLGSHCEAVVGNDFINVVLNTGESNDYDNDVAEWLVMDFDGLVITIWLWSINL